MATRCTRGPSRPDGVGPGHSPARAPECSASGPLHFCRNCQSLSLRRYAARARLPEGRGHAGRRSGHLSVLPAPQAGVPGKALRPDPRPHRLRRLGDCPSPCRFATLGHTAPRDPRGGPSGALAAPLQVARASGSNRGRTPRGDPLSSSEPLGAPAEVGIPGGKPQAALQPEIPS